MNFPQTKSEDIMFSFCFLSLDAFFLTQRRNVIFEYTQFCGEKEIDLRSIILERVLKFATLRVVALTLGIIVHVLSAMFYLLFYSRDLCFHFCFFAQMLFYRK